MSWCAHVVMVQVTRAVNKVLGARSLEMKLRFANQNKISYFCLNHVNSQWQATLGMWFRHMELATYIVFLNQFAGILINLSI